MRQELAAALAGSFLTGEWSRRGLVDGGAHVLGHRPHWLTGLAHEVLDYYPRPPTDRPRELRRIIDLCPSAQMAGNASPVFHPVTPTRMVENPWRLPELHNLTDVADFLGLRSQGELAWFSDPGHWARTMRRQALRHYRVTSRATPSGSVRVLEAPKPRLRELQRSLLDRVIGLIPVHDAAHGFRPGRSVRGYTAPHASRPVVVHLDLEGFFAAVTVSRVYGLLRTAGYPEPVAHCLAGLMTTVLPRHEWNAVPRPHDPALLDAHWRLGRRLAAPHLPQGSPTSPAVANLAAHGLDVRLTALARTWDARYTRYADDLAFSGDRDWHGGTARLIDLVGSIAEDEGFRLNRRKTSVSRPHQRQRLGGLVINESPRVSRNEVDRLRAILHNCARYGASSQNRQARPHFRSYLLGRIAWVAQHDPVRGAALRARFDEVDWSK